MKVKKQSLLKLATVFIALLFCAKVNAAFIESRTLQGDNGGAYTYQLYSDRLEFSLGYSDTFDITNILFPFLSNSDAEKLVISGDYFSCNLGNARIGCSGKNNLEYDSFTGIISFKQEFQLLFQFTGYNFDRNVIATINKFDGARETFYTGTPIISAITQSADPVNAPATISLFALASILMLRKRFNLHSN